ncbi:hypothetical protein JTE90_021221 [Oedothorax gibbosus]|uniref:Inositol polyphosphate-related phosphatase domain-containing protein n=1 Tax=Oedothorax gibbosus TaxID=931172 RepID=A0AAV6UX31_9ARAC|nr:hypothetical protein JTE90_021221 [Oedothorax gibbosus]
MFSSLPSASKIYVNSSNAKPRQKSAANSSASRRKKKKSLPSSGSDGGPTLVSLVDPAKNSLENRFERVSPPRDILDRTFRVSRVVLSEDSEFSDGSGDIRPDIKCPKESNLIETVVPCDTVSSEDDDPRPTCPSPYLEEDPPSMEGCGPPAAEHSDTGCMSESTHAQEAISNCVTTDCVETDGVQEHSDMAATKEDPEVMTDAQTVEEMDAVCDASENTEYHSIGVILSPKDENGLDGIGSTQEESTQGEESLFEQEGAPSPDHGELSCTESYESKTPDGEPPEEVPASCQPDVSRSCSDLGSTRGNRILRRSSSFPTTRNSSVLEEYLGSLEQIKRVRCVDKGTATVELPPCETCTSRDTEEEQRALLTTNKAVSAELGLDLNKFPALTTAQARSRSYVYGSTGHTGSLLGNEELSRLFPDNEVTIFVGTWNMNSHSPPPNLDEFLLPLDVDVLPDIYAVGVQEGMQSRWEWEVCVQGCLGPSHALLCSSSLGVLHLALFVRRDLLWFCSEPEEASVATRPGTMVKTKGAVAVSFQFFGTSFLFLNSHLAAHEQRLKERLSDYEKIVSSLDLPKSAPKSQDKDVTSRFDVVLWCGDLNFRVVRDRPSVLSFVEQRATRPRPSCSFLVKHDQLHQAMEQGSAFKGFREGVIHFDPSYKFEVGTSNFAAAAPLRVPSYTDRILYRCKEGRSRVSCVLYDAASRVLTSDHKPVFGVFRATLRPGRDSVPLAAGLFKRDVYLEALRRRSQFVRAAHSQSTVCSVM